MRRLFPHPLLTVLLLLMWLLLQQSVGLGNVLLGAALAIMASLAVAALEPERPRIGRIDKIVTLVALVTMDILRSNLAVCWFIISGRQRLGTSGFVKVPLELRDRVGLTILACIVTATPGSAWLEYSATRGYVLIHVLDLEDEQGWIDTVKHRYERLLLEIFR